MRNTLTLLTWAMQGLAHADRSRRERLAGIKPPLTGADAMHVYLKEHGIDVPHLDKLIKGLMQEGKTAGAVKELITVAADAAANPHDLGAFVQHLARCCAPTGDLPVPPVTGLTPAAAPPGTSWTAAAGKQPHFRPEFTSAARRTPPPAAAPPPTASPSASVGAPGQPRFRPEFTSEARRRSQTQASSPDMASNPGPTAAVITAANDVVPARLTSAAHAVKTSDDARTAGCNDPIPEPLRSEDGALIDALGRRVDAFETRIARELLELKDWMNAQFQELARRIEAQSARQARMQAELDELRAQLRRVEFELLKMTRPDSSPAETLSVCIATSGDLAAQAEPVQDRARDAGETEAAGTKLHSEDPIEVAERDALAIAVPEVVEVAPRDGSQVEETTNAAGVSDRTEESHASDTREHDTLRANEPHFNEAGPRESKPVEFQSADAMQHEVSVDVVGSRGTSLVPLAAAGPRSLDERIAAAEARIEAGLHVVAELKGEVVQRVSELFQKLETDKTSPTAAVVGNACPSEA
ncbi:hypothetical protein [Nannocystis pusilla]|uniref:hypothetical protein n=1 Tax=Nannocystis pusilla TaxID=889268 RepID=UPI003BF42F0F